MSDKPIAIVTGVGPGTGSAIVRLVAESPDPAAAVRAFAAEMKAATRV